MPALREQLGFFNFDYVNRIACHFERSGDLHLFALVLLRTVLVIQAVSSHLALGCLACYQSKRSVLELRDLTLEGLALLLVLLLLSRRVPILATLGR
jgi:hypothetical protein